MKIENYEKCFCPKVRWVQNIIKSKFDDETETMNEIMEASGTSAKNAKHQSFLRFELKNLS